MKILFTKYSSLYVSIGFPGGLVVKTPPVNAGDVRDIGSIPASERSPGGGHGHPLQHSCLRAPWTKKPEGHSPRGCE